MLNTIRDLYIEHIRDLYSAETQIVDALPKMIEKATHPDLRDSLSRHLDETRGHVKRLQAIAKRLDIDPEGVTCEGMKGLLDEGAELLEEDGDLNVIDAAIISAGQRVEHYEIAAYGCARTYARSLNLQADVEALQMTLNEEGAADKTLTVVAEGIVHPDAAATR